MTSTKIISDFGIAKLKIRVCGKPLKNRRKENIMSAIKTYTPETLAKEIKSAVEWLKEEDCGCVTLKLNGVLAVCVGWSDGFDPGDETVIHGKPATCAIVAAIKVWTTDDMRTDLDYIDAPYYEDGSVYDTEQSIYPDDEDYVWLATHFLNEFDFLKELDIDEKGLIHE